MKTLKIALITLLISPLALLNAEDTIFSIDRANVWIDNGVNSKTYHIPEWSQKAEYTNSVVRVGSDLSLASKAEKLNVLVNNTPTSYPPFTDLTPLPSLSLVGLDYADILGGDMQKPILNVTPEGGDFNETIEIVFELNSQQNDILFYNINNKEEHQQELNATKEANKFSIYLSKNGDHNVSYHLKSTDEQKVLFFTIKSKNPARDSDGDGIPDSVEIELGMNPLAQNYTSDGWSPFDSYVRGNNLIDSDGDGWSDFDETTLRDTDAEDNRSKPTATSLYGVEYRVTTMDTTLYINGDTPPLYRVSFIDMTSNSLYDSSKLEDINLSAEYYNVAISGAVNATLTTYLNKGEIPQVRVPASNPLVLRVRENNESNSKVSKTFIDATEELSVAEYYPHFLDTNTTGFTAESFKDGYIAYLQAHLVAPKDVTYGVDSTIEVSILEAALRNRVLSQTTLLLGNPNFSTEAAAYENTKNSLRDSNRTFNNLVDDLLKMSKGYLFTTPGLNDVLSLKTGTTEDNLANFMQNSLLEDDRYKIALMSIVDYNTSKEYVSLLTPDEDSDGDDISNKDEVFAVPYTHPLLADSDNDGLKDGIDPCPNDKENGCLNNGVSIDDFDGDGIVDSADNCPFHKNEEQEDKELDGIGDVCAKNGIVILTPRTNITLFKGDSFTFEARKTLGSSSDISWFIDKEAQAVAQGESYTHTFTKDADMKLCASLAIDKATACVYIKVLPTQEYQKANLYTLDVTEGDTGSKNSLVELVLRFPAKDLRTYSYSTVDYTANMGDDYINTVGTLNFQIGEQRKYIRVPIVGDSVHETVESFYLQLASHNDGEKDKEILVTILDNDAQNENNGTEPPAETNAVQNSIFFAFQTETYGSEPWMSDGSESNTTILKDLVIDSNGSYPANFTKVGGDTLYFSASDADYQMLLYKSDGTSEGTISLGALDSYEASSFLDINGTLYFTIVSKSDGVKKLYKSSGDAPTLIGDLSRGYESSGMGDMFTRVGGALYFQSYLLSDYDYDNELYKFDIQSESITLVKDINPGEDSSDPHAMTNIDGSLYFIANSKEIWKSDGTEAGTTLVIAADENQSFYDFKHINGKLYYVLNNYLESITDVVAYDLASQTASTLVSYTDSRYISRTFTVGDTFYMLSSLDSTYEIISISGQSITTEFTSDKNINELKTVGDKFYFTNSDGLICNSDYSNVIVSTIDGEYLSFMSNSINDELYFKVSRNSVHALYKTDSVNTTLLVDGSTVP